MTPLTLELPDSVSEEEARLLLAIKLYEVGRLSCGKAAELAGFSKRTFMEILGKQEIAVFNYSPQELMSDLQNA